MSDIRDEVGPSVLNPHQSCYAKYQGVVCPWCRIAALEAEQEEFRKDRKELNERYDEMTHKYELRVQALEAENERLKEYSFLNSAECLGRQLGDTYWRLPNGQTIIGDTLTDVFNDGKAAGKREAFNTCAVLARKARKTLDFGEYRRTLDLIASKYLTKEG